METNTKGKNSKRKIIESAAYLFLKNGYNNTGIKEILLETNLPKGSFYFHFNSKKDLAIEVASYFKEKIGNWIFVISEDKKWDEFVEAFMNDIVEDAKNENYYGCPFAVLGTEMAFIEPEILEYYHNPMKNLITIFLKVLEFSGAPKEELESKAMHAFALFEGYIMYYRITKDIKVLEILKGQLKSI
ncbi:TetR/AcrR family transcriptional regulator [Clostridium paraputrificum]|uniref:TetR/AcrR family transcriptional regulator n=1 Tax=Clostridium TaxID=1485 RepID=UPI003D34FAFD